MNKNRINKNSINILESAISLISFAGYDDDTLGGGGGQDTSTGGGGQDTTTGGSGQDTLTGNQGGNKNIKFTPEIQVEVNRLLANERRQNAEKNKKASELVIKQLEEAKTAAHTTETQKLELQQQIDALKATFQTSEEKLKEEVLGWEKRYKADLPKVEKERDTWKNLHDNNLKSVDITQAAVKYQSWNPSQIEAVLKPLTSVIEDTDAEGKKTGKLVTAVDFPTIDKDSKTVTLRLSVDAAVKKMTELPDLYGNLFKNTAKPGSGDGQGNGATGGSGIGNIEDLSPDDYAKNREKIVKNVEAARKAESR